MNCLLGFLLALAATPFRARPLEARRGGIRGVIAWASVGARKLGGFVEVMLPEGIWCRMDSYLYRLRLLQEHRRKRAAYWSERLGLELPEKYFAPDGSLRVVGGAAFEIPNEANAPLNSDQAEIDAVDLKILASGSQRCGVVDGCAVTAQGTPDNTVAVAAGTALVPSASAGGGLGILPVGAGNKTIEDMDANPRYDLITTFFFGSVLLHVIKGTAAVEPEFPITSLYDTNGVFIMVPLAAVYVPGGTGAPTITQDNIIDKRMFLGAGSRTTTMFVAASNASPQAKAQADYLCDGIDDQVQIETAMSQIGSVGGCVTFSEGTFTLGDQIDVLAGIHLKGQGYATLIFRNANDPIINIEDVNNTEVSDLRVRGSNTNTHDLNRGVQVVGTASESMIRNVWTEQTGYDGIVALSDVGGTPSHVTVMGCHVQSSFDDGINFNDTDFFECVGNKVRDLTDGNGIHISMGGSNGVHYGVVQGNIVTNVSGTGIDIVGSAGAGRNTISITGNMVFDCDADGIQVQNAIGIVVQGNTIRTCGDNGINMFTCSYCTVAANVVYDVNNDLGVFYGIYLNVTNDSAITGNVINDVGGNASDEGAGIRLGNASRNTVSNNRTDNTHSSGIWLSATADNNSINGNVCSNAGAGRDVGILVAAGCDNNNFVGNNLSIGNTTEFTDNGSGNKFAHGVASATHTA